MIKPAVIVRSEDRWLRSRPITRSRRAGRPQESDATWRPWAGAARLCVSDFRAFTEAGDARNAGQMRDELVNADLEQIPVGGTRRRGREEFFVPAQCPAPLADLWIGEVRADIVCEAVPDLADKSQVSGDNFSDQPKAITGGHSASIGSKRSLWLE